MNPLMPSFIDVVYAILATVNFFLVMTALVMVWREYVKERDLPRALKLLLITIVIPIIGATATIVDVRKHQKLNM